jgi:hypothetical protein
MKQACGFFLIVFLLSMKVSFGQKENNSALDKIISIEARNEAIESVLEKITVQAHVYFSYDPTAIHADKKIDASITSKSIREILDILLESKFTYQELDQQIVITLPDSLIEKKEVQATGKPKIITFHGKVIDRDENDFEQRW